MYRLSEANTNTPRPRVNLGKVEPPNTKQVIITNVLQLENAIKQFSSNESFEKAQYLSCINNFNLLKKENNSISQTDFLHYHLDIISQLIIFGKLEFALMEVQSLYHDLSALLSTKSPSSNPTLVNMIENFKYKPMIYSSTIISLVFRFFSTIFDLFVFQSLRSSSVANSWLYPSGQDIVRLVSKDSVFRSWFLELDYDSRCAYSRKITSNFLKLSMNNKTVLKLCYLMLSIEFMSFTEDIRDEVIDHTIKSLNVMASKNSTLVYKYTHQLFFSICETFQTNKIPTSRIEQLIKAYSMLDPSTDKSIWSSYLPNSKGLEPHIETTLKEVRIAAKTGLDKLSSLLDSSQQWDLMNNPEFCALMVTIIKRLDLLEVKSQQFVISLLTFLMNALSSIETKSTKYLIISDILTVKLKSLKPSTCSEFCYESLSIMYIMLKNRSQPKRLRNFSNLAFHFGGVLLSVDVEESIRFWMACINFEYNFMIDSDVANQHDSFRSLKSKCERITNMLLENSIFEEASMFISKVFQCYEIINSFNDLFKYQNMIDNDLILPIKLVTKLLISMDSSLSLGRLGELEATSVSVLILAVKLISKSSYAEQQKLITKIIIKMKNELKDNGLFLFFLSSISFSINFNIGLKSSDELSLDGVCKPYGDLIFCHLCLLQCMSSPQILQTDLLNSYHHLKMYLNSHISTLVSDYEIKIIEMLVMFLRHTGLYLAATEILSHFIKTAQSILTHNQLISSQLTLLEIMVLQEHYDESCSLISLIESNINSDTSKFDLVRYRIHQLRVCTVIGDMKKANLLHDWLLTETEGPEFLVSQQTTKVQVSELLLLLSNLSSISGFTHFKKSSYVSSINSYKRSLRILQSLMKNFIIASAGNQQFDICFKFSLKIRLSDQFLSVYYQLLNTLLTVGLMKDFDYYEGELIKFIPSQPSSYIRSYYYFILAQHQALKGDLHQSHEFLSTGSAYYDQLKITGLSLDSQKLCSHELYFQLLNDSESYEFFKTKVDELFSNLLKTSTTFNTRALLRIWDEVRTRRAISALNGVEYSFAKPGSGLLQYKCHLQQSFNEISKDPFLRVLSDSVLTFPISSSPTYSNYKSPVFQDITQSLRCSQDKVPKLFKKENNLKIFEKVEVMNGNVLSNIFLSLLSGMPSSGIDVIEHIEENTKHSTFIYERKLANSIEDPQVLLPSKETDDILVNSLFSSYDKLKKFLPRKWAVVTIDYNSISNSLILTKITSSQSPFKISLPVTRSIIKEFGQNKMDFKDAINELRSIIDESKKTTSTEFTEKIKTAADRSSWWDIRRKLDKRLEALLRSIEFGWFGGFKGIFGFLCVSEFHVKSLKERITEVLKENLSMLPEFNKISDLLDINQVDSFVIDLLFQLSEFEDISECVDELMFFILDSVSSHGQNFAYDELDLDQLSTEIESELKIFQNSNTTVNEFEHIILVPSMECAQLPWESLPCLEGKSVSRMPSLTMLTDILLNKKHLFTNGIDPSAGYYIVNPGGDLKRTEANFKNKFEEMSGWNGVVGNRPREQEIRTGLSTSNIYVYIGHGGGEQYIKSKTIKSMSDIPPTLLLGCSSGQLTQNGVFPSYGTAYNYLIGGCPMLLVNLWDVTDKDIDKFTFKMFEKWGLFVDYDSLESFNLGSDGDEDNSHMGVCVSESRSVCKMRYLNGAAPVLYGLPLKLINQ